MGGMEHEGRIFRLIKGNIQGGKTLNSRNDGLLLQRRRVRLG